MNTTKQNFSKTRIVPIMDDDDTVFDNEKTVPLYDGKAKKQKKNKHKKRRDRRVYPIVITEDMLPAPQWDD